jgi:hypothetical protein
MRAASAASPRQDHAPVAERAEVLRRVEAERGGASEAAGGGRRRRARRRLRRVLEEPEPVPLRERGELRIGARRPKRCTGTMPTPRPRAARSPPPTRVRVEVERRRVDVAKTGVAPRRRIVLAVAKKVNGVVTTARPGPHAERGEREEERIGPGRDADRVRHAAVRRHRGLEPLDRRPEDELLAREHLGDRRAHLAADRGVLRLRSRKGPSRRRPP